MELPTTIALSRLVAQSRALEVTATNIANAGTPGFRAERMLFSDWLAPRDRSGSMVGARMPGQAQAKNGLSRGRIRSSGHR